MSLLVIPTFDDDTWQQSTALEGVTYTLTFQFNQRCAAWYLSIADQDGVDIYNGVKLVCNVSLLRKCKDPRCPPGALIVFSSSATQEPPSRGDLIAGGACQLMYLTSDGVAQIRAGNLQALVAQAVASPGNASESTYGQ